MYNTIDYTSDRQPVGREAILYAAIPVILQYYINKYRILCLTTSDSINLGHVTFCFCKVGHQETKLLTAGLYEHKTIDYPNY